MTQLQTLQAVSSQLAQHQSDLAGLLSEIPAADSALPQAVRNGYVQLYENIIVCGIPGLGEDSSAAFTCAPHSVGGELQMISRRLVANLIVFFVVSFALVVYGVVNLLGNPLQSPTTLTTQFADASGLYPGLRGGAQRRAGRHRHLDRADQDRHEGHHAHQPRHDGARRRPVVGPDRQRPR